MESKSRRKERREETGRRACKRNIQEPLAGVRKYAEYFPRICRISSDLYNSTSVIAFKDDAIFYCTSESRGKEKSIRAISSVLLFCNLSPDIREISARNLVFVTSSKRRESERRRKGEKSIKGTISSFDTFNLAAAV